MYISKKTWHLAFCLQPPLKKKKLNYSLMLKLMLCWTFCMFGNLTWLPSDLCRVQVPFVTSHGALECEETKQAEKGYQMNSPRLVDLLMQQTVSVLEKMWNERNMGSFLSEWKTTAAPVLHDAWQSSLSKSHCFHASHVHRLFPSSPSTGFNPFNL